MEFLDPAAAAVAVRQEYQDHWIFIPTQLIHPGWIPFLPVRVFLLLPQNIIVGHESQGRDSDDSNICL